LLLLHECGIAAFLALTETALLICATVIIPDSAHKTVLESDGKYALELLIIWTGFENLHKTDQKSLINSWPVGNICIGIEAEVID